jgi:lipopolysaccharide export system permease protein
VILSRYLTREVFGSLLAVTFILLLIFLSNQLVRFLSYAAAGKMASSILLQLLGFEIPYLLALLLPLGLYLGIILAYGRLYADNELNVMQASGLSQKQLMKTTSYFTVAITALVLVLMLWINPYIAVKKGRAIAESLSAENVLAAIMPGRFQASSDGRRVVYVESVSRDRKVADNLFFADQVKVPEEENTPSWWSVVSAVRGYQTIDRETHKHFLVAEDGNRYEGIPGQNDYKIINFKIYLVQIPGMSMDNFHQQTEAIPTSTLLTQYADPMSAAELQWRLSIPLSAFLLSLLAIPLSHVQPRQGRYSMLFPAILIYVVYVNLLFVARNWVEQKSVSIMLGMWWVHILFLLIVASVIFFRSFTFRQWMARS